MCRKSSFSSSAELAGGPGLLQQRFCLKIDPEVLHCTGEAACWAFIRLQGCSEAMGNLAVPARARLQPSAGMGLLENRALASAIAHSQALTQALSGKWKSAEANAYSGNSNHCWLAPGLRLKHMLVWLCMLRGMLGCDGIHQAIIHTVDILVEACRLWAAHWLSARAHAEGRAASDAPQQPRARSRCTWTPARGLYHRLTQL